MEEVFKRILIDLTRDNTPENLYRLLNFHGIDINYLYVYRKDNTISLLFVCVCLFDLLLETLLECGADPNQMVGEYNRPILHAAIHRDCMGCVSLLIAYGAKTDIVFGGNQTLVDTAITFSGPSMIERLMFTGVLGFKDDYVPLGPDNDGDMYHNYLYAKKCAAEVPLRITRCKKAIYGVYLLKDAYNKDILYMVSRLVWQERRNKVWLQPPHNN